MEIVIPLTAVDLELYLKVQRPTLERFYANLATTWIVTRPEDLSVVRAATDHLDDVRVLNEHELVPEAVLRWIRVQVVADAGRAAETGTSSN